MKAVNLIPTEQRRAKASGKQNGSSYVLIGLLVTLLAMVGAYVVTSNNVKDRESKAAAAKAEAKQYEAEVAQRGSFTNFAQIKATRLASVVGVASTRFDWERLMRELSRVMPADGWLQSAEASVAGDAAEAAAAATSETAAAPQPTADLVGCTPKQEDVAAMMVRLRQMHRVSDVTLNESRVETAGKKKDITFDSCGSYYQFNLTVSFEPTAPATEAPVGQRAVPASLGGGS